jgi:hypothetical protein
VGRDADDRRRGPPPDARLLHGAYRKPREINWMVGMWLLVCTLVTGFTGYSLVYEQLSYWGATVGANIADSVPLVGALRQGHAPRRRDLQRAHPLALLRPPRGGAPGDDRRPGRHPHP